MHTIVDSIRKEHIRNEPFPYAVVYDALPKNVLEKLRSTLPALSILGSGKQGVLKDATVPPNNEKLRYYAYEVLADQRISPEWRSFVSEHLTSACFGTFLSVFGEHITKEYPGMLEKLQSPSLSIGTRHTSDKAVADVLIDAEITADTPVTSRRSVKRIHIDNAHKLGVAMFYVRPTDDDSQGGAFQIFSRIKNKNYRLDGQRIVPSAYEKSFSLVEEVPYKDNSLVIFLNTSHSFHGVSTREVTSHPRYAFNLVFELREPLFNLEQHIRRPLLQTAARYAREWLRTHPYA